jgi:transposase-like protein
LEAESTPKTRIPLPVGDIQVNFCKNPACANFGVPASISSQFRGPRVNNSERDDYTVTSSKGYPSLKCNLCGELPPLKSNIAIQQELNRISGYLDLAHRITPCPNKQCANHSVDIAKKQHYYPHGKTKSGSQRYKCRSCGKVFSVGSSTVHQKKPHKNLEVFRLLVNKMPFKRICDAADISMPTLYDKIDFIHRQCLAFVASREAKLLECMPIKRLYLAVDRQDYMVNWTTSADKRNVVMHAVGSADNETGYVFGLHLNFDPSVDSAQIEQAAEACGDLDLKGPFRQYAGVWLSKDYEDAIRRSLKRQKRQSNETLPEEIISAYEEAQEREDIEVYETQNANLRLPPNGMQVHAEYTLYGHFMFLKKMFGGVEKIRFFLDQDSGMRGACLGTFADEIKQGMCDAFYVRINRDMTITERKKMMASCRKELQALKKLYPKDTEAFIKLMIIKQRMKEMMHFGKWQDKWISHPFPNMGEPEKAMCYLTDIQQYDEDHLAWLYNKASLHSINRFFMQVRRRLSLLERPIATPSSAGRKWHGYSAYNPTIIIKLLDILRVFYNYIEDGDDKYTPAMRLGLAKGNIEMEDIIYYM